MSKKKPHQVAKQEAWEEAGRASARCLLATADAALAVNESGLQQLLFNLNVQRADV